MRVHSEYLNALVSASCATRYSAISILASILPRTFRERRRTGMPLCRESDSTSCDREGTRPRMSRVGGRSRREMALTSPSVASMRAYASVNSAGAAQSPSAHLSPIRRRWNLRAASRCPTWSCSSSAIRLRSSSWRSISIFEKLRRLCNSSAPTSVPASIATTTLPDILPSESLTGKTPTRWRRPSLTADSPHAGVPVRIATRAGHRGHGRPRPCQTS